jgi:hypothetical protein
MQSLLQRPNRLLQSSNHFLSRCADFIEVFGLKSWLCRVQVPQPILLKSPEFLASGNKLFRFMLQYRPMRGTHDLTASYDKY